MSELIYELYRKTRDLIKLSKACENGCDHTNEPLFKEWEQAVGVLDLSMPIYRRRYEMETIENEVK